LCINPYKIIPSFHLRDRIGGVMVSVLALSAVDCEFEPQSGQTKKHTALKRKSNGAPRENHRPAAIH
jgi:hypothetical protein